MQHQIFKSLSRQVLVLISIILFSLAPSGSALASFCGVGKIRAVKVYENLNPSDSKIIGVYITGDYAAGTHNSNGVELSTPSATLRDFEEELDYSLALSTLLAAQSAKLHVSIWPKDGVGQCNTDYHRLIVNIHK